MKKIFKSLRSRIILLTILVGIVPIILLHILVVNTYEQSLINQRKIELKQRFSVLTGELSDAEKIEDSLTKDTNETLLWFSEVYGGRVLVVDPYFRVISDSYSSDVGRMMISNSVFQAFQGKETAQYDSHENYLNFTFPVMNLDTKKVTGVLVVTSTTEWIKESLTKVEEAMEIIELILSILLIFIAVFVSGLIVAPIQKASAKIQKVQAGHIQDHIEPITSYNEVDKIVQSANDLIEQYRSMEENQEQFVSNVSHELRTPMTSVKVLSDSLIGQSGIPEETYQEFLSDISQEINRETLIIEDLLSMSKLGKKSDAMKFTSVNINEFIMQILKTVKPIALSKNVEIVYESFRDITADIDEPKLSQAFLNLIENAVKYNNEGGQVQVSLDADQDYFYLRVRDNGIGIPEESLPYIFDRFYRVDKARSRESGGTGLGLPIAKQIVLLHEGLIKAESEVGKGTTFTVRIPLTQAKGGKA